MISMIQKLLDHLVLLVAKHLFLNFQKIDVTQNNLVVILRLN